MILIRILLSVVFAWTFWKTASVMLLHESMDLTLLRGRGEEWIFWSLVPAIGILTLGALTYLWAPSAILYRAAQAAIAISFLETLTVGLVAADDPPVAKAAFIASRNDRGLPVREEMLQLLENPNAHYWQIVLAAALSALWLYLLFILERRRRRDEAERNQTNVTPAFTDWH